MPLSKTVRFSGGTSVLYVIVLLDLVSLMARPLRLEFSVAVYHITADGYRREPIFLDDADRLRFVDLLSKEVKQRGLAGLRLLFYGQPLPLAARPL
jgi:hypothetical protein